MKIVKLNKGKEIVFELNTCTTKSLETFEHITYFLPEFWYIYNPLMLDTRITGDGDCLSLHFTEEHSKR